MSGLYIHVPFCARKCLYCDFYSLPVAGDEADVVFFLKHLRREFDTVPRDFSPETAYIGGGTPTVLQESALHKLLESVRSVAPRVVEWTVEANPGTLDLSKARLLKTLGVNRISLGVQSLNDAVLQRLGRIYSAADSLRAWELLREAGFDNISVDLIFGVPGQTRPELEADLQRIIALGAEHISCYALSIEPGTPFDHMRRAGEIREVAPEIQREQYDFLRQVLRAAGYIHYEISNFAQPGRMCRHNINYWEGGEYLGFGPAAHSHWRDVRWGNVRDLREWARRLERGESPREFEERLAADAKARETLILNLRLLEGVTREAFAMRTGMDYDAVAGHAIRHLVSEGWLVEENGHLRLSERALFVSNAVLAELV